ncbi:AAA family ATPase [Neokomagataea anthophila]|uniref:AAA family ATPase n=1 Tax=Neokomagataea anthophila TaxID=2826925 RepID=A0ABS5E6K7_9PROT|nr:AAA family ATPase [Neokomagataea anthophila]MBR0559526.1 AAA family ATPase [Neokomagataea anthophila]
MSETLISAASLGDEQVNNVQFSGVVGRFRSEMQVQGLTVTQAAAASGIAKGTLHAWLAGTYAGVVANVDEKAEKWLASCNVKTRVRKQMPRTPDFIMTPSATIFFSVFSYAQAAPDIGLITGNAGVGKTMSAKAYQRENSNVWILTADTSMRSPSAVLRELAELVDATEKRGTRMMASILNRVRDTQGLLIIDEAQNFTTEAIDLLRTINDRAEIGIVFMGNEPLKGRIEGLGRTTSHAQIFSRIGKRKNRARPQISDMNLMLDAWGIDANDLRKTCRWIAGQPGGLRVMNKTLRHAFMLAGDDALEDIHIEKTWKDLTGAELPSFKRGE